MSLLTNESSIVALTTLRQINRDLTSVQQQISTGKSVSNARDNAAIFAVSAVIQSDADSFDAISSSLNLGASTVAVARGAAEQVTGLLQEIKTLVVSAQEDNVDRAKIQTDIGQLRDQITSIVNAAQFNGLNLVKGTDSVSILASLDRAADGSVTASSISIARSDLSITGGTTAAATGTITATLALADGSSTPTTGNIVVGGTITAGEVFTIGDGTSTFTYTAQTGDDADAVGDGLRAAIAAGSLPAGVTVTAGTGATIGFQNTNAATTTFTNTVTGVSTSGLAGVATIDVSSAAGATAALSAIEGFIQTGINAAASFGSTQKRIDIQNEFINTLTDSLRLGIGALTDADLEAASARLQSLQVQQQLGVQALSIANQRPQILLNLFR